MVHARLAVQAHLKRVRIAVKAVNCIIEAFVYETNATLVII